MRSNSANDGTYTLAVTFALGTNPDINTVNVNNRVQSVLARLPQEVQRSGVLVRKHIHDAFMKGPDHAVELFHGYTYSAHPLACAAALATLDIYAREDLFGRVLRLESLWGDAVHALRGLPHVADIRTVGLVGAVDLDPNAGGPGKRGFEALNEAFHKQDLLIRSAGDTLVLAPPLIVSESQSGEMTEKLGNVIRAVA